MTSVDLPPPGHAGDAGEQAERNFRRDVLQVVARAPTTFTRVGIGGAASAGRDLARAGQRYLPVSDFGSP